MKDRRGKELQVGDTVLITAPYGYSVLKGTIVKIRAKSDEKIGAMMRWYPQNYHDYIYNYQVRVSTSGSYEGKIRRVEDSNRIVKLEDK